VEVESLTSHLEQEAQQLREQIVTATARLSEIEMFLRLATQFSARYQANRELTSVLIGNRMRQVSQRDRIVATVAHILIDGRPRSVRELRGDLEVLGVQIGGADPHQTLSTYLSRDPKFQSRVIENGRAWTLSAAMATGAPREWLDSMRNRLARDPDGPFYNGGG
jgi:transcriptional regulator of acetoin/glycerol metabolism